MFCIVDHFFSVFLQVGNRITNDRQILFRRNLQSLFHMKKPRFTENGYDGRLCIQQRANIRIFLDRIFGTASRTECCNLCMGKLRCAGSLEEFHILRIRSGPSAFDVRNTKCIKPFSDLYLVFGGEGYIFSLGAVAQRCIVKKYFLHR